MSEQPNYRKSSYSGSDNDACVEVADNMPRIMVRDSKFVEGGSPEITASPAAWTAFLDSRVKLADTI
ncbi:DUF397 domain-containing protein [Streptomyces tubercidicus]|uniref:DUF397 domain-containing protein n=1 Tax=Streptomyces tubercidicus TaxID=47759 RepID=A0A640UKW0_9ACTN|nr:DUF397 domain-containing protein [Streptomyces tubercidicus]WAU10824.1 DUF397 domain-containing protein [Streptomyces tubercidicus]GFE35992.1 hypothetical protein Stube_06650 [Streptomyces tubercidicus]